MLKRFRRLPDAAQGLHEVREHLTQVSAAIDDMKVLAAKPLAAERKIHHEYARLSDAEFKCFSQFGDDGILQYLIGHTGIEEPDDSFVELGVEDYREANTKFVLLNDNWRGLLIEADENYVQKIHQDAICWRHDLSVAHAFVTADNVNEVIQSSGFRGSIGLVSIDIDGNDYWVWESLAVVEPVIVVIEYNSLFGWERAVTIPYDPMFERMKAHYSGLYWGCSLRALHILARLKGYAFVGCNSHGNNAYFVKEGRTGTLPQPTLSDGYVNSRFRESRDRSGNLSFVGGRERIRLIADMPLYDLESQATLRVGDL